MSVALSTTQIGQNSGASALKDYAQRRNTARAEKSLKRVGEFLESRKSDYKIRFLSNLLGSPK